MCLPGGLRSWHGKGGYDDNEELNTRLYEKMFAEQEQFRDWLLSQPPAEILNHAYEYTVREDILMSLEYNDLEDSQARALLKSGKPLKQILSGGRTRNPLYGYGMGYRPGTGQGRRSQTESQSAEGKMIAHCHCAAGQV